MWQKARILKNISFPEVIGREIWVKCQPPHISAGISIKTGKRREPHLSYVIAIEPVSAQRSVLDAAHLELLPEFTEDVPLIPWSRFLACERDEPRED
jgi:hypothetical protein